MLNMESIANLYLDLESHFKGENKSHIAREAVSDAIPLKLYYENLPVYERVYEELYLFYSLYSQNTTNVASSKVLKLICRDLEDLGYEYEISFYERYFYKHKRENIEALRQLIDLLRCRYDRPLYLRDLVSIKRVGVKSASLICNQFIHPDSWPVVDVNVFKAYLELQKIYDTPLIKTPNALFLVLVDLNNFCQDNLGFELSRLLYAYQTHKRKNRGLVRPCETSGRSVHCKLCPLARAF